MNKFGLLSDKPTLSFDIHLSQLDEKSRETLLQLRKLILKLGDNVVEEIRPHRIVYAKSMTFRYFLDVYPNKDNLEVIIRKNRKDTPTKYTIKDLDDLNKIEKDIETSFKEI